MHAPQWLTWILLTGAVAILLPVRVALEIKGSSDELKDFQISARLRYLLGLFGWRAEWTPAGFVQSITLFGLNCRLRTKAKKSKPKSAKKKGLGFFSRTRFFFAKRQKVIRYLSWLYRSLHGKDYEGRLTFGFADPSLTGEVFGMMVAISGGKALIAFEPNFIGRSLAGLIKVHFYVLPITILSILMLAVVDFFWNWQRYSRRTWRKRLASR